MARGVPDPNTPKEACPECHRDIATSYLQNHRRQMHAVYGGRTGIIRNPKNGIPNPPKRAAAMARPDETITVPIIRDNPIDKSPSRFRVLDSMKVLTAEDGSLWIGEKIRD